MGEFEGGDHARSFKIPDEVLGARKSETPAEHSENAQVIDTSGFEDILGPERERRAANKAAQPPEAPPVVAAESEATQSLPKTVYVEKPNEMTQVIDRDSVNDSEQ